MHIEGNPRQGIEWSSTPGFTCHQPVSSAVSAQIEGAVMTGTG